MIIIKGYKEEVNDFIINNTNNYDCSNVYKELCKQSNCCVDCILKNYEKFVEFKFKLEIIE